MNENVGVDIQVDEKDLLIDVKSDVLNIYPKLEDITIIPSAEKQVFKSNEYGYNEVTVEGVETEELNVTPSLEEQSFQGLYGKVNIEAIEGEELNVTPSLEEQNYEGVFGKVNVGAIEGEEIKITPSAEEQVKEGVFSKVIVEGESNLRPEIIAKDEVVFGVVGTGELRGEENAVLNTKLNGASSSIKLVQLIKKLPSPIDIDGAKIISSLFNGCELLEEAPEIDITGATNISSFYASCKKIKKVPQLNTSTATNMMSFFNTCTSLEEHPEFDMSNVASINQMFYRCKAIKKVSLKNLSKVTNAQQICYECDALEEVELLGTILATNMGQMFYKCPNLKKVSQIDCSSATAITYCFDGCYSLEDVGGLLNIGKGYTTKANNYSNYTVSVVDSNNITHESLMNIINGLYDLNLTWDTANGGTLYTQILRLGDTNIAKLTSEEIAIATSKGWTVK